MCIVLEYLLAMALHGGLQKVLTESAFILPCGIEHYTSGRKALKMILVANVQKELH